ncbi:MAG: aspartate kinase [Oscillospiraceae bacterium]|nr:aspartate kinase [Oscillospiraceae bacterium]
MTEKQNGCKVVKFGGSSLADAGQFEKVKSIITAEAARRYVVPSAPGKRFSADTKITDMLYTCQKLAAEEKDFSETLAAIRTRYLEIAKALQLSFDPSDELDIIAARLKEGATKDYAASRGEYLNGMLLADYLQFPFVDAAEVIRFNENGTLQMTETMALLRNKLKDMPCAVIPGFYGAGANGEVITFSRGGSDITGSLVARAVRADIYENWTDVSGVLVADPRIVKNAAVINTITYEELRELSYMGATVLHEDAIFPVRAAGIPINIRNTNEPSAPGTLIVAGDSADSDAQTGYTITGIAGKKGFCAINIQKAMMNAELGFCRKVLTVLEELGISFEHMPSGIDTMSIILSEDSIKGKEKTVLSKIRQAVNPDACDIEHGISLLAVVGRGMCRTRGTAARIFAALAHARINVKMIDQGSSELNIIIGLLDGDFEESIRRIYDMFVNSVVEEVIEEQNS